jgi:hypothetical protein
MHVWYVVNLMICYGVIGPYVGARLADLVSNSKIDNNGSATE